MVSKAFGSLASLLFEVEKDPKTPTDNKAKEEPAPATQPTGVVPQTVATPTVPAPAPIIPASIDEKMMGLLSAAIDAANIDGFDYIEFRNSLVSMASVPMPENAKFQAVFATAQTMGASKNKIIESIDHYQGVIDGKKNEFMAHVEAMVQKEITAREEAKAAKEAEIAQLVETIQAAQLRIAEAQQEILALSNEINQESLNIKNTAASFEATYNFVSNKLRTDKDKIQTYLAG